MTCRTLLALISAAVVWILPHTILAQVKQDDSETALKPTTDGKGETSGTEQDPLLQLPAKKPPAKGKAAPGKPAGKNKPMPGYRPSSPGSGAYDPSRYPFSQPSHQDLSNAASFAGDVAAVYGHQFGAMVVGNYLGAGVGLEYVRRSLDWMDWGLQVVSTQTKLTESSNPDTDEFLQSQTLALKAIARFFYSRWIYLQSGLSLHSIRGSYGWQGDGVANEKISTTYTSQQLNFDVTIGSQWEPGRGFYLGVDWLGLGIPLSATTAYKENAELDELTEILSGDRLNERIRKELNVQFQPFYLLIKFGYML